MIHVHKTALRSHTSIYKPHQTTSCSSKHEGLRCHCPSNFQWFSVLLYTRHTPSAEIRDCIKCELKTTSALDTAWNKHIAHQQTHFAHQLEQTLTFFLCLTSRRLGTFGDFWGTWKNKHPSVEGIFLQFLLLKVNQTHRHTHVYTTTPNSIKGNETTTLSLSLYISTTDWKKQRLDMLGPWKTTTLYTQPACSDQFRVSICTSKTTASITTQWIQIRAFSAFSVWTFSTFSTFSLSPIRTWKGWNLDPYPTDDGGTCRIPGVTGAGGAVWRGLRRTEATW